MPQFNVYSREGKVLQLAFERFEVKDGAFVLYDGAGKESADGFLSFENVAAVVPAVPRAVPGAAVFHVHLKTGASFEVRAHGFKVTEGDVAFEYQERSLTGGVVQRWGVSDVYVAASEVLAIVPKRAPG